ncbi:hypothetical protein [Aliiglaciecola sp. M165]|uniref:hypothetical protein n=1 Tax=Aliiglaciecola sp. M165 TaxID=2593649 RepID=UPI00117C1A5C|nr:hypothetical protein [Aliiglaciecola sp. M165]TRY33404.1 hypothetical protein FM019_05365 [Aliiglaciecola sp. M165]
MQKFKLILILTLVFSPQAFAWKYMTGKVEVFYVNTYGNYSSSYLNGGFCFKIAGYDHYLKIAYAETGEQRQNLELVQSMVMAASMADRRVKATYVDWGNDTSCRENGAQKPAKWLENLQMLN